MIWLLDHVVLTYLLIVVLLMIKATSLINLVIFSGVFSLLMSAIYMIMGAADVAITEAAVGVSISTIFFLNSLRTVDDRISNNKKNIGNFLIALAALLCLFMVIADMPNFGEAKSPVHNEVMDYYLQVTKENFDFPNVVTAILASFRGYDTLGETTVIMTAALCVLLLRAKRYDKE